MIATNERLQYHAQAMTGSKFPLGKLPFVYERHGPLREKVVGQVIARVFVNRFEDPCNSYVSTDHVVVELASGTRIWLPDHPVEGEPAMYIVTNMHVYRWDTIWEEQPEVDGVMMNGATVTDIVHLDDANSDGLVLDDRYVLFMDVSGFRVVPFCRPIEEMAAKVLGSIE